MSTNHAAPIPDESVTAPKIAPGAIQAWHHTLASISPCNMSPVGYAAGGLLGRNEAGDMAPLRLRDVLAMDPDARSAVQELIRQELSETGKASGAAPASSGDTPMRTYKCLAEYDGEFLRDECLWQALKDAGCDPLDIPEAICHAEVTIKFPVRKDAPPVDPDPVQVTEATRKQFTARNTVHFRSLIAARGLKESDMTPGFRSRFQEAHAALATKEA